MAQKNVVDRATIGDYTWVLGEYYTEHPGVEVSGQGLTLQETANGYKMARDWDETRDMADTSLRMREKRHVWQVRFFNKDGQLIGNTEMSEAWEPIKDLTGLPAEFRAADQLPKPEPFLRMTVAKDLKT